MAMIRKYYVLISTTGDELTVEGETPKRAAEHVLRALHPTAIMRVHSADPGRHDSRFYKLVDSMQGDGTRRVVESRASEFYADPETQGLATCERCKARVPSLRVYQGSDGYGDFEKHVCSKCLSELEDFKRMHSQGDNRA